MDGNKKFYEKPELNVHGDIMDITLGGPDPDIPDINQGVSGGSE